MTLTRNDLPRLFDPWCSTKGSRGMGISLYLAHEILKLHGTRIETKAGRHLLFSNLHFGPHLRRHLPK